MADKNPGPELFTQREAFLARVTERLGKYPTDFQETFNGIAASGKTDSPRRAAGVLLPLLFRESPAGNPLKEGQFFFQLIKRSAFVPQPGDLSCPGGMLHPFLDHLLRLFLVHGPFPTLRGAAWKYADCRGPALFRILTLFLSNAIREAWEEIRLSPLRIRFLGPLPTYSLQRFSRTIFPLAGYIAGPWNPKLNREVEKIVEIPLDAFYRDELFGCLALSSAGPSVSPGETTVRHPCMVHSDSNGKEEILWGATFNIILQFLGIVMEYRLPAWQDRRVIKRELRADYLTGRVNRASGFPLTGGPSSK